MGTFGRRHPRKRYIGGRDVIHHVAKGVLIKNDYRWKNKKIVGLWPIYSPVAIYLLSVWGIREYMWASMEGQGALHLFHVSTLWDVTSFLAFFVASSLGMLFFLHLFT